MIFDEYEIFIDVSRPSGCVPLPAGAPIRVTHHLHSEFSRAAFDAALGRNARWFRGPRSHLRRWAIDLWENCLELYGKGNLGCRPPGGDASYCCLGYGAAHFCSGSLWGWDKDGQLWSWVGGGQDGWHPYPYDGVSSSCILGDEAADELFLQGASGCLGSWPSKEIMSACSVCIRIHAPGRGDVAKLRGSELTGLNDAQVPHDYRGVQWRAIAFLMAEMPWLVFRPPNDNPRP